MSLSQRDRELGQQPHMSWMDQVEAAIGEADPQSLCPPRRSALDRLVARGDLAVGRDEVLQMQHTEQFVAADRRRAWLAHSDTRRDVGKHCRLGQRGTCTERDRQRGHQRIAGARHIGDLARPRRQVQWRLVVPHQGETLGGARHQHGRATGVIQRTASRPVGLAVVVGFDPGGPTHFILVRGQDRGATIAGEVHPLRVRDHHATG